MTQQTNVADIAFSAGFWGTLGVVSAVCIIGITTAMVNKVVGDDTPLNQS